MAAGVLKNWRWIGIMGAVLTGMVCFPGGALAQMGGKFSGNTFTGSTGWSSSSKPSGGTTASSSASAPSSGWTAAAKVSPGSPGSGILEPLEALEQDEVLVKARAFMDELGIANLESRGTLDLSTLDLNQGIHILSPERCGIGALAGISKLPVPGGFSTSCSLLQGTFMTELPDFGTLPFAIFSSEFSYGSATRYTGEMVSDVAVVIANKVIFDEADVTLADNVKELWIIAGSVESTNSSITWNGAVEGAPGRHSFSSCASSGIDYNPNSHTSYSAFHSPDGERVPTGKRERMASTGRMRRMSFWWSKSGSQCRRHG